MKGTGAIVPRGALMYTWNKCNAPWTTRACTTAAAGIRWLRAIGCLIFEVPAQVVRRAWLLMLNVFMQPVGTLAPVAFIHHSSFITHHS